MFHQVDWVAIEHTLEYDQAARLAYTPHMERSTPCIRDEIRSDFVHVIQRQLKNTDGIG